jgi:hypothetical protein
MSTDSTKPTPVLTLNSIRQHGPCKDGWEKLLSHLGKTQADDEPLPLLTVLNSNGLQDTLWCFRALSSEWASWARLTIADIVQPAMKYTTDPRPQQALDASRAFARGEISQEELDKARDAASAACVAAYAADAAYAAAYAAAAADAAANAATNAAAYAAYDAARAEQEKILRGAL